MLHGSPRVKGNSDALLDVLAREIEVAAAGSGVTFEHVHAARLKARPCLACGGCDRTGACIVMDEMQEVYAKVRRADLLLIGSPVFFGSVSAQLKAVIDRFQCAWVARYKLKEPWLAPDPARRAALLCVGGMTAELHFRQTRSIMRAWLATLNTPLTVGLWFPAVDARGDAAKITGLEAKMREAAAALLESSPVTELPPG